MHVSGTPHTVRVHIHAVYAMVVRPFKNNPTAFTHVTRSGATRLVVFESRQRTIVVVGIVVIGGTVRVNDRDIVGVTRVSGTEWRTTNV